MPQSQSPATKPIRKLLVANRGEIALRVVRTARQMGIVTVAVFSDPDCSAPHVAEADEAVRLPGATPADTYLRGDLLVDAARLTGADAIHPGYGFLAENAAFARACAAGGVTFVGPPVEAIEAMGSKVAAKEVMTQAGVPTLPSADATDLAGDELAAAAAGIGFPLLVKASFGGGGRGMRIVRGPDDLAGALSAASREAASAFGNGAVFLERYLVRPRHIEVQVFADAHGNVVSLFERDCSVQRRHQKIVEESPSPAVDETLRASLGEIATTAAQAVGYVGAGTVEMLMESGAGAALRAPGEGDVYFLEMNTRLQVEHPVTEMVTGLDLVRLQLLVASGEPLPADALRPTMSGHAIEVRLYAEDPEHDWRPSTGTLHRFEIDEEPGVRVDTGVHDGSEVSPYYDPLLAKVIAWAPTRDEAASTLAATLRRARLHGVTTNRDLLVRILTHPELLDGKADTGFLERHDPAVLGAPLADDAAHALHAVAAALALQAVDRSAAAVLGTIPSGWRNNPSQPQSRSFTERGRRLRVDYRFARDGQSLAHLAVNAEAREHVAVIAVSTTEVTLDQGGVRRRFAVHQAGRHVFVDSALGSTTLTIEERFPSTDTGAGAGSLVAPLPGEVIRLHVAPGDMIAAGDPLVVIEAMKMEHTVGAPTDGTVAKVLVEAGDQVDAGTVLAVLADAAETAASAAASAESFPTDGPETAAKEGRR